MTQRRSFSMRCLRKVRDLKRCQTYCDMLIRYFNTIGKGILPRGINPQSITSAKSSNAFEAFDTGLFYFSAGAGEHIDAIADGGGQWVTDAGRALMEDGPSIAAPATNPIRRDIDTPAMARQAETVLLRGLIEPTDGVVSRRGQSADIDPHSSIPGALARWRVAPNAISNRPRASRTAAVSQVSPASGARGRAPRPRSRAASKQPWALQTTTTSTAINCGPRPS